MPLIDYVTQHFDNARTGWNPYETELTTKNVERLRLLFSQPVDGVIYAQPLYVHDVEYRGRKVNVVYVATQNNTVYAFDADAQSPALWQLSLTPNNEAVVSSGDLSYQGRICGDIVPTIGITSTPVIHTVTKTMYAVAKTKRVQNGTATFHHYLYAIDIVNGKVDRATEIMPSFPGTQTPSDSHGNVLFSALWQLNRPGLLLANDLIYVAFGAHCDNSVESYHGWIVSYDKRTLDQVSTFNASPDLPKGNRLGSAQGSSGIWQGGVGLSSDSAGFIYCVTGNGVFDVDIGGRNYGDTALQFLPNLTVTSYFTPADQEDLAQGDRDFGSSGVLVLPDQPPGSSHAQLAVVCGKPGDIYLLDRRNFGGFAGAGNNRQPVQKIALYALPSQRGPGQYGGAAYYSGARGQFVFYCGNYMGFGGPVKGFILRDGILEAAKLDDGQLNQSVENIPNVKGATLTISSDKELPGTAILWLITHTNPLQLMAFDPTDLRVPLVKINAGPWIRNGAGAFIEPTVANGKVYTGSQGQLNVFGL